MRSSHAWVVVAAAVVAGCSGWQRDAVKAAVIDELECPATEVIVQGPVEPGPENGVTAVGDTERVFRGACSLWWDERVVLVCDEANHRCRVADVGPPRTEPRRPAQRPGPPVL